MRQTLSIFLLGVLVLGIGCAQAGSRAVRVDGLDNAREIDNVYLGGQPTIEELGLAATAGVRTVINLRLAEELDFDEDTEAEALGLVYFNPGFQGDDSLTDAIFDRVRALLTDERRPIYLHCDSGNRTGAVWAAHRAVDQGLDLDAAIAEAKEIGLHSDAYERRVREYVGQH